MLYGLDYGYQPWQTILTDVFQNGIKQRNIILILDGYDEYEAIVEGQQNGGAKQCIPEVDLIVRRRKMQNINLVVTSRPWKAEELLRVEKFEYKKVDMNRTLTEMERNKIISNFFPNPERSQELISFIEQDNGKIIPIKMTKEHRTLLYICNTWDQDIE